MELRDLIRKYALQNAVQFDGIAQAGAVIGKVLTEKPELKNDIRAISRQIVEIVREVNKLDVGQQKAELEQIAPQLLEKKKGEKKDLPELKNAVEGHVVTRLPPEPSKYLHLGHAMSFLINYMYAKKYKGRCILRFDDTNPKTCSQEYVDSILDDFKYLKIIPDETRYVSDDMEQFYSYAEQLLDEGKGYVCICDKDTLTRNRQSEKACVHRSQNAEQNLKLWQRMKAGKYEEGEAVFRLKIDMSAENQVLRDPIIFRICYASHYRQKQKYRAWPMYDFESAVEEHITGVTHILRSNEFGTMRQELQDYIKDILNLNKQYIREYGRITIKGSVTKGREIRELIQKGKVSGWDDPGLVTLKALRRRGITTEAYYELVKEVGLSPSPTNVDPGVLETINRKILDPGTPRYFFVNEPAEITVENAPEQEVEVKRHPSNAELGSRKFKTGSKFYLANKDVEGFQEGESIRLAECLNFIKKGGKLIYHSKSHAEFKGTKIIHWLPVQANMPKVKVLMPDRKEVAGLAEPGVSELKVGDIVQFLRFGFCRLDKAEKGNYYFWFTHP